MNNTPDESRNTHDAKIKYILDNILELNLEERVMVLQLILNSGIDINKVSEKPSGTQVKFKDMSKQVIQKIHDLMYEKIELKTQQLNNCTKIV